jgi:hypothetical protein
LRYVELFTYICGDQTTSRGGHGCFFNNDPP